METEQHQEPAALTPDEIIPEDETTAAPRKEDLDDSERSNLAAFMSPEMQKSIASKVRDRYDRDLSSRSDRMKRLRDLQEMYALVPKPKNFPFHKAANVKTPALTGPNLQIQARLYDMVWPPAGKIFTVVPATAEDQAIARITETFANSYVRYRMPYMAQGLDDTLHQMCLYGSAFRRTYWDAFSCAVRSDWVPLDDFVVNYKQRSQDPSMSDVGRYTFRHWMTRAELADYGDSGTFVNTELVTAATGENDTSDFKATSDKIDGQSTDDEGDSDEDVPRPVLEQHCRWKLPNSPQKHPAFNGKARYVVILIDAWSSQVLRIALREEDDPDDKRRFDRQQQAFEQYQDQMRSFLAAKQAQLLAPPPQEMSLPPELAGADTTMPPGGPPEMGPPDTTMPAQAQGPPDATAPLGAPPGPPPQMPPSMQPLEEPRPAPEPAPIRKRQICFFTHYRCFPSEGFYGLGYGDLLYGLCKAEDTLLNQHIDGVTLKNAKPMFMSRSLRMKRGEINVQPGSAIEVDAPMGSIRDAIMFLDPPQNDPSTVPLVKLIDGMKDSMVGSSDMMSGQGPGSNQTKAGIQLLAEQAMTPITVLARRVKEAFRHELDKMWRCWGVFLEDEDIADVVAEGGVPQQIQVGKWMFSPTAHLVPASDPRMKSQRIEDHMALVGYVTQNPLIMQNPQVGMPVLSKLLEAGLRIFPDGEQLIPLLQPPQQEPPPPEPKPQWAENAGFLKGEDAPVLPDDDHDQHISELQMFMQSPDASVMDKVGRDMSEKHLRGHYSARLMKNGAQLEQQRAAISGSGPPGAPPMAGPPDLPPPPPAPGLGA